MSSVAPAPFTPEGAPTAEFIALILLGRERGWLTTDDLMMVLRSVELSPRLIDAVVGRVRDEGIEWRDDTAEAEAEPPSASARRGSAKEWTDPLSRK